MTVKLDLGRSWRALAGALVLAALAGCGGDDGDRGPRGEPGSPISGERNVAPEELNAEITDASTSSPLVVEFQVTDERGLPVAGLRQGENVSFSFTVSKLVPGSDGENETWQSYIIVDDEGQTDFQPGTYDNGELEGNGDGTYRFTFARELEAIAGVAFEPELTHRVGMEIRDAVVLGEEVPGGDAVFDFQPSSGDSTGIDTRKIVKQESCATCHGTEEFAFHGGPRQSVDYCVTCHQKGAQDYRKGDPTSIDFRVMIHRIHEASDEATFCGFGCENFGADLADFSEVTFPQDVRNCTNCHDPADPDTPQAININNRPTAATCASCHEDLAVGDVNGVEGLTDANGNHPAGPQPNSNCATCHSEGGLVASVLDSHVIPTQAAAKEFEYNVMDVSQSGPGQSPMITFEVTDPTNDDARLDIQNDPAFTSDATRFVMTIAWPTTDYRNFDAGADTVPGSAPATPFDIDLTQGSPVVTANGDGTFTVNTAEVGFSIPSSQTGSGAVTIEGHPGRDVDGDGEDEEIPVKGEVEFFPITDSQAQSRRQVVELDKCQACHAENDGLALHGGNRTDNIQQCATCHNPNNTDLAQRPEDPDGTVNGVNTAAPDNLEERAIDLKFMIHAIHGSEIRENDFYVRGFGNSNNNFAEVTFPRSAADCVACHAEGTYELPLGSNVLATTDKTQATVNAASPFGTDDFVEVNTGSASDPTDDNNVSPTAAVCSSCHDSASAEDHMSRRSTSSNSLGDAFVLNPDPIGGTADTQAIIDTELPNGENCAFCHGPGRSVDIADAHDLGE